MKCLHCKLETSFAYKGNDDWECASCAQVSRANSIVSFNVVSSSVPPANPNFAPQPPLPPPILPPNGGQTSNVTCANCGRGSSRNRPPVPWYARNGMLFCHQPCADAYDAQMAANATVAQTPQPLQPPPEPVTALPLDDFDLLPDA